MVWWLVFHNDFRDVRSVVIAEGDTLDEAHRTARALGAWGEPLGFPLGATPPRSYWNRLLTLKEALAAQATFDPA